MQEDYTINKLEIQALYYINGLYIIKVPWKGASKMGFSKTPDSAVLLASLQEHGVSLEETVGYCRADLTIDGIYAKYGLVLTKTQLHIAFASQNNTQKVFAGVFEHRNEDWQESDEIDWQHISLENVEKLVVEPQIGGGLLCCYGDTVIPLCCATGQYLPELRRFCQVVTKVKEGKSLGDEDYKDEARAEFCETCGTPYVDRERKICPKCMDRRSLFVRTFSYFKPYRWRIVTIMTVFLIHSALYAVLPYFSGAVYFDDVLGKKSTFEGFWSLAGGDFVLLMCLTLGTFLVLRFITVITQSLQAVMVAKIVPRVLCRIKQDVFAALKRLSLKFFTDRQTGSLMTRVLGDAGEITGFFIDGLPYVFGDVILIVATVAMMFVMNWQLATLAVTVVPTLTFFSNRLRPMLWHLHGKRHRAARGLNSVLNDSLTGTRVIKAFGKESGAIDGFDHASARMANTEISVVAYENRYFILFSLGESLLNIAVWFVGAWLIILSGHTEMSYGTLATFVSFVGYLSGPLQRMTDMFRWGTSSMNAAQRIFEIIDAHPDIEEKANAVSLPHIRGEVSLSHVTFSYQPGHPVLNDVSFTIPAGHMLGIVGRSGVGKSTLVSLIARLYDPDSGQITIDGVPIEDLSLDSLHRSISTVSQESYVFMGTVAENIAYVCPEATRKEIIDAAVSAGAHDFICKMPDGYDTVIGSGGRQLSGGERQRLSVARAILADSPILILDEATASVDTATERQIQTALNRLIQGRTTISIAHRLSTLRNADHLMVMEEGKVAEYGTHEQLMERRGIYYKLVELQTKALSLEGRREAMKENLMIE